LLWSKNAHRFGISTNEKNVAKYLTIDQSILKIGIRISRIHQHKQTCGKKQEPFF
jgi:hypothetical protein